MNRHIEYVIHFIAKSLETKLCKSGKASELSKLTLFEADTRDSLALEAALRNASAVVCTTGVPAFGISGQQGPEACALRLVARWEKGNHPETVDHFGVKNAAHVWSSGPGPGA